MSFLHLHARAERAGITPAELRSALFRVAGLRPRRAPSTSALYLAIAGRLGVSDETILAAAKRREDDDDAPVKHHSKRSKLAKAKPAPERPVKKKAAPPPEDEDDDPDDEDEEEDDDPAGDDDDDRDPDDDDDDDDDGDDDGNDEEKAMRTERNWNDHDRAERRARQPAASEFDPKLVASIEASHEAYARELNALPAHRRGSNPLPPRTAPTTQEGHDAQRLIEAAAASAGMSAEAFRRAMKKRGGAR